MMQKSLIILIIFMLVACSDYASGPPAQLGDEIGALDSKVAAEIETLFEESGIPSMAVAVVVGDEVTWARGFGEQPDLGTVYMAGSIDKAYLATAFLQMVEDGKIGLDDDISDYLPFELRNPHAPKTPITPRMLLSHRSGLVHDVPGLRYLDNDGAMLRWRFWNLGNNFWDLWHSLIPPSETRAETIETVLSGEDPDQSWVGPPNGGYQYSNTGLRDVLGRAIAELEDTTSEDVIQKRVLDPLNLENTSFEAFDFPKDQLAIPYARFEESYQPMPITGLSGSGRLRTTVLDLARFMALHMNEGTLDDVEVLSPESIEKMHTRHVQLSGTDFPSMQLYGVGWGWQLWGEGLQGHSGAVPGFYSQMVFREHDGTPYGVVLMINTGCSVVPCDFEWFDRYFVAIREMLLDAADEAAGD